MNWLSQIIFSAKALFLKKKLEMQLTEEVRTHVDMATEANITAGMSPEEARYAALREFGNVAGIQERTRDEHGWVWLENLWRDIRFAFRALRRSPGFSLAVMTTLALCIGPNTAILSALYTFVYKPLPFPDPDRLVSIANVSRRLGGTKRPSSIAQYQDFMAHADRFEGFAYFAATTATLGDVREPVRVYGMDVSPDFFRNVGVPLLTGRSFRSDEQNPGKEHVVVLSHGAWVRRFQADPQILGRLIRLDEEPYTIVGVAAPSIELLFDDVEFFRPRIVAPPDIDPGRRYAGTVRLLGRLKPGVPIAAAQEQLATLERGFIDQVASPAVRTIIEADGFQVEVADARRELAEPVRAPLWLLQGGAALVLLLGCVNVASLLLARSSAKRQELAVRHALGAGRSALLRQTLAESLLLVGAAGVTGLGVAMGMLRFMNAYLPTVVRHVPPIVLETRVLGIVLGVLSLLVGLLAIVPAVSWWRADFRLGDTPNASPGRRARRTISVLVVGQLALAVVLLVGAGLMLHSFARVMAVQPGFDADRVVQGRVFLPQAHYRTPADLLGIQNRIVQTLEAIPGADSVGLVADFPVKEKFNAVAFRVHDGTAAAELDRNQLYVSSVSAGFFSTMGIRLRDGRLFRDDDDMRKDPVAIVDETFARRFFPGREVVGMELVFGPNVPTDGRRWIQIVGVVARANLSGLEGRDGWPFAYVPFNQQASTAFSFVVRSARSEADIVGEIRERVRAVDAGLPVYGLGSLSGSLDFLLGNRRAMLVLVGLFASLALMLAAVGLYGVLNYDVSQRTREIGIRGALGASHAQILALVIRQGLAKVMLGIGLGTVGAAGFTRLLNRMLFDVSAADPVAYGTVFLLLLAAALAASWLPARRAAKVDPVIALRAE